MKLFNLYPFLLCGAVLSSALQAAESSHEASDETETAELDAIVVQADLREHTDIGRVPASVAVLDEDALRASTQQHFNEVIELVPNLHWASGGNRPRHLQIRGIGERSQYEGAPNPSVGFLVDDIDFTSLGPVAGLFDVEQIDVLRGPQGTRFGANALAGLVYIKTHEPSMQRAQRIETLIGDDGQSALGLVSTGPLNDTLAYRLAVQQHRANGFRHNDYLDRDDTHGRDEFLLRGKLASQTSDRWQFSATYLLADLDNGYDAFAPENGFTTHSDKPGRDAQKSSALGVRLTHRAHRAFDLVSLSSLSTHENRYDFDGDWGNPEYWGEFSPYDFTAENDRDRDMYSQELRLVSKPDGRLFNDSTDWVAGLYWHRLQEDNAFLDLYNGAVSRQLDSAFSATTRALFGQLTHANDRGGEFTLGLRHEQRRSHYRDSHGLSVNQDNDMQGGQIAWLQTLGDNHSGYVSLSRGYKGGGFNLDPALPTALREYGPEQLWNLEAGLKGHSPSQALWMSFTVFHSQRRNMQVSTSRQLDPNDPLTFVFFTANAASGTNQGLETELRWHLSPLLTAHMSLALLDATFDDFIGPDGDISGREQAHAPSHQYSLGLEYQRVGGFFTRVDVNGSDGFYFSDSHAQQAPSYALVNFKSGFRAERWAVYLWARNLFDRRFATRGFFFGLEPPDFPDRSYLQLGHPRHFGLSAEFLF